MNVHAQRLRVRGISPWLLLAGPAFAVSIGYIDPGNWATDLAAGVFGLRLLWVVVAANAMAIVLQVAVVRLTALAGNDLGTLIARGAPQLRMVFWSVFQLAAIATDLAEFTGITLGLSLLFHWPLPVCVCAGAAIVILALSNGNGRSRLLEGILIATVGVITLAFAYQLWYLHPAANAIAHGMLPTVPSYAALVVVVGIIGATVMPHNLFLHSSMVHEKSGALPRAERMERARFHSRETLVALNLATFINGGILVVGALLMHADGSVQNAFGAWVRAGAPLAATLFGAALLITGVAASVTATMSGDYIFRSFSPRRIPATIRRCVTLAPAGIALLAGADPTVMLIWSQVALSIILPVALVPMMLHYRKVHIEQGISLRHGLYAAAWTVTIICLAFDVVLLAQTVA
jgi:manganese transport protein